MGDGASNSPTASRWPGSSQSAQPALVYRVWVPQSEVPLALGKGRAQSKVGRGEGKEISRAKWSLFRPPSLFPKQLQTCGPMREQYGACSQREGGAKGRREHALSQLYALLGKEAEPQRDREVSGEVEGERQEQWGGEERDRKVKMERHRKTQKKGRWRHGRQTETHPERPL